MLVCGGDPLKNCSVRNPHQGLASDQVTRTCNENSGDVKGTIRNVLQHHFVPTDVRRHRLISISYISLLPCHGSGRIVRPSDPIISFSSWRVSRAQSSPVHYSSSLLSATTKQYCVKGVYAFLYFGRAPRSRTRGRILVLRVFERSFECVRFCMRSLQPWVVFG